MYIRCSPGLALYQQDLKTGFIKTTNSTKEDTFLLLSQVPVETGGSRDKPEQYYHFPEGFVLKGETSPEQLSQYDLGKQGFTIMKDTPESFVHLDGKKQPKGLVRQLYEKLLEVSQKDRRVSNALDPHNYRRLLNKIDSNRDGFYSPDEYRRAVHNPSYRDTLYKTIVMHPSDWYYRSDEDMWAGFIKTLEKYAPDWVPYTQQFTDRLCWMQALKKLKLGPVLWHMHPIAFLSAFKLRNQIDWNRMTKQQFTDAVFEAALKEQEISGIPAAITTAQAIDESGYGRKVPVDLNNKKYSFNLFGIKAKSGQESVEIWTTEHINGRDVKIKDRFAAYSSFEESIAERTKFLIENKRYASLFESDDPEKWAHGLQNKGYATDPNYASKLISIMKGSYMKSRGLK
ncbi:glucosaminidase domain-containing protein [Cronobacter turicensis]